MLRLVAWQACSCHVIDEFEGDWHSTRHILFVASQTHSLLWHNPQQSDMGQSPSNQNHYFYTLINWEPQVNANYHQGSMVVHPRNHRRLCYNVQSQCSSLSLHFHSHSNPLCFPARINDFLSEHYHVKRNREKERGEIWKKIESLLWIT